MRSLAKLLHFVAAGGKLRSEIEGRTWTLCPSPCTSSKKVFAVREAAVVEGAVAPCAPVQGPNPRMLVCR